MYRTNVKYRKCKRHWERCYLQREERRQVCYRQVLSSVAGCESPCSPSNTSHKFSNNFIQLDQEI